MCRSLASRSSQRFFFSEKLFFAKFSKCLKNQIFCKKIFPFCSTQDFCTFLKSAQNSASLIPFADNFEENLLNF